MTANTPGTKTLPTFATAAERAFEMRIELDLTDNEIDWLQAQAAQEAIHTGNSSFLDRVTRAIERAESFVDDDNSGNKQVECEGCGGIGIISYHNRKGVALETTCFYCSGTGKEYV